MVRSQPSCVEDSTERLNWRPNRKGVVCQLAPRYCMSESMSACMVMCVHGSAF